MRFFIRIKPVVHGATCQQTFPLTGWLTVTTTNGRTIERWKKSIPRYVSIYVKKRSKPRPDGSPSLTVKASREPQNPIWNQGSREASSLKEEGLDDFGICTCMLRLCYERKNRYFRRSHLSEAKFRVIIRSFALDLPASKIAELSDVSRPTINQLLLKLRIGVAQVCDASSPFSGEVEVDESYFGARRVRGRKGRGAGGKTIVFGILERQGKVYTEIIPATAKRQTQAAILGSR